MRTTPRLALVLLLGTACHVDSLFTSPRQPSTGFGLGALSQFQSDSTTTIPMGGSATSASIVVGAVVADSDTTASVRLQVELHPVGTAFTGQATSQSDLVKNGARAYALESGLADNTAYHWQARIVDQKGDSTAWQPFGGNAANATDFRIATATLRLMFRSQPKTTTADSAMSPVEVDLVDDHGSTVTTFTGTVTLAIDPSANPGGAPLGGTTSANAVAGAAMFSDLAITTAASGYRLEATSDTFSAATSASFAINPGAPDHLSFLNQPTNTTVNQAITPAVRVAVQDVYGNVCTSFTDVMFMNIGNDASLLKNATLDPAGTHRAASAGISTFEDLKIDQIGLGYTIAVSAAGTRGTTSSPFDVNP